MTIGSLTSAAGSLVVAALLMSATATAAEFTTTVRTIDEVADGAMPHLTDITATTAVLEFVSNRPLACSVVYGETPAFGNVATDTDMAGGAHTDHHPVLGGLTPATTYSYRVQGVAADGTIYLGEVMTFVTATAPAESAVNLLSKGAGATVTAVSSNFGGGENDVRWGAAGAVDGDRTTAWSSWGDGDDAYIEITLPERARVGDVAVWSRSMSDGSARIAAFTLTTDTGDVLGPFVLPDAERAHRFRVNREVASLRLEVTESTGGNVGLIEFAAFPADD